MIRVVGEAIVVVNSHHDDMLGGRDGLAMSHAYCSVILHFP